MSRRFGIVLEQKERNRITELRPSRLDTRVLFSRISALQVYIEFYFVIFEREKRI